ncbi:hypothetical protein ABTD19_17480, partial [Acinetobacter baumannii]
YLSPKRIANERISLLVLFGPGGVANLNRSREHQPPLRSWQREKNGSFAFSGKSWSFGKDRRRWS